MKVKKLICLSCGNTEEFIVDSDKQCVGAVLRFENGCAELDDSFPSDIDIFPANCAICGQNLTNYNGVLKEKKASVCEKCEKRFWCFTERNNEQCSGFEFEEKFAELT